MLVRPSNVTFALALSLISMMLFAGPVFGQSAPTGPADDLESEITTLKAENAAVRERLRTMEEQQKALMDQVARLLQRLDGTPVPAATAASSSPQTPVERPQKEDRYQDGVVIWQNAEGAKVPFLLK